MSKRLWLVVCVAWLAVGCDNRKIETDLSVVDVHTGWYDVGIVDGQNKLVPSVSFALKNVSQKPFSNVHITAQFKRVGEAELWGEHFIVAIGDDPLAAGATTNRFVLRSQRGYTGLGSRAEMLHHKQFVDTQVVLLAKHGASPLTKIAEFPVARTLLMR